MIFHNLFKKNTLGNFRNGFIFTTLSEHHIQSSQNNGGNPQTGLPKNPPPPNLAVQIPPNLTRNKNTEPLDVEPQGFPGNASDFVGRFSSPKTRGNYRSKIFPKGSKNVGFFAKTLESFVIILDSRICDSSFGDVYRRLSHATSCAFLFQNS